MTKSEFTIETDILLDKNKQPVYRANIFFNGEYRDSMNFKTENEMMSFIQYFVINAPGA